MFIKDGKTVQETADTELQKKWLFQISGEYRAYIKGAIKALLYVQENSGDHFKQTSTKERVQS